MWFAFKKLYLCSDEQQSPEESGKINSCDLLSKNCIFVLTNNIFANYMENAIVVICFQKIVSLFWRTTQFIEFLFRKKLWFAFKKLYLCSDEQHMLWFLALAISCDLLSKNCIFVLTNNHELKRIIPSPVVICFQKIVSLFWRTTLRATPPPTRKLWFAFKKLYLCSDEQRRLEIARFHSSCDLLSKNCIFVLTNNKAIWIKKRIMLWFAFKKLYLCSDEQL